MRVLFVDDEPALLGSLRRMLRQTRSTWEAHFVESVEAALTFLADHDIDVVVSDCQMPGVDGMTLLKRLQHERPEIGRIMLSGQVLLQGDTDQQCPADEFHAKPCPIEMLCDAIERVANRRKAA